jgi:predicted NBD/HSP70 family sugar kinase
LTPAKRCSPARDSVPPTTIVVGFNTLALSEYRQFWPRVEHFFFIKAGTGIGSGIILNGAVYRGARGASGDIGHIQFDEVSAPLFRCGKFGCVEARAAGWAIARDLRANGYVAHNARDVIDLLEQRVPDLHSTHPGGRTRARRGSGRRCH